MKVQPTTQQLIAMLYERLPELFDRPHRQSLRDVKPLTDEEIICIEETIPADVNGVRPPIDFARAIEAFHGIKENT